jgi:hypothetical protein
MKGMYTGLGLVFGAGLGLVIGLLALETWWYGMLIGSVTGLVLGSMAENAIGTAGSDGGG